MRIRDALAATRNLQLLHAVITMDEFHNPKDKDAVILKCDPEQQRALYYKRIRPE
jgi:branched-chain amino acid transport system substrate-binding protein